MVHRGHVPQRTCVACRRVRPARELMRLVVVMDEIVADRDRRLPGRGAYVCPEPACVQRARDRAAHALRARGARWAVKELV